MHDEKPTATLRVPAFQCSLELRELCLRLSSGFETVRLFELGIQVQTLVRFLQALYRRYQQTRRIILPNEYTKQKS